jgi:hypothetical protein
LRETLPGRRLGDAGDDDGGGSSLANTADPRRGKRRAVAGVELVVGDNLAVVRLVPKWSKANYVIYRCIMINSLAQIFAHLGNPVYSACMVANFRQVIGDTGRNFGPVSDVTYW